MRLQGKAVTGIVLAAVFVMILFLLLIYYGGSFRPAGNQSEDYNIVKEAIRFPFADKLNQCFIRAREQNNQSNPLDAAEEVRKAITLLDELKSDSVPDAEYILSGAMTELQALALNFEALEEVGDKRIADCFSGAHFSLAMFRYINASYKYANNDGREALKDLKAAVYNLRKAVRMKGINLDENSAEVLERIAGKTSPGNLDNLLADFGEVSDDLMARFQVER